MAELVDALGSGPSVLTVIGVQVSFRAYAKSIYYIDLVIFKKSCVSRLSANLISERYTI